MSIIPKGKEPTNVKRRIDTLFPKLDSAYPDKIIISLAKDHKKWDETAREISKQLGYDNKNEFLEAYGYKIEKSKNIGGRPSNDYMAIIDELKKRYPNGSKFIGLKDLAQANPDLSPKFKTLKNKANELFGMTFAKYLVNQGILIEPKKEEKPIIISAKERAERRVNEYRVQVDEVVTELKKRYTDFANSPGTIERLRLENSDLPIHYLTYWIPKAFKVDAIKYLEQEGVINLNNKQSDVVKRKILIAQQIKKPLPTDSLEFLNRNFVYASLNLDQEIKIKNIILARGGNVQNSVDYKTDYLITNGNNDTSKYNKATKLLNEGVSIQILSYHDFIKKVSEYDVMNNFELPEFVIEKGKLITYTGKNSVVTVPKDVKTISKFAFYNNTALTEIHIGDGVSVIEKSAFEKCKNLKKIVLPNTLLKICDKAFENCINIEDINIPDSVVELGKYVFNSCVRLNKVSLPKSLKNCGGYVFSRGLSLKSIELPKEITRIPHGAFYHCISLEKVIFNEKTSEIGGEAFTGCVSLSEITLPKKLSCIRECAFAKCSSLCKVKIPNKIKRIDSWAFSNCTKLAEVELHENLTKLEEGCFAYCTSLSKIVMYDSLNHIGDYVFKNCINLTEGSFVVIKNEV